MNCKSMILTRHSFNLKFSALQNSTGAFILNGKKVIDSAVTKIKAAGTIIEYSGSDTVIEMINASGPIKDTITLLVKD